MESMEDRERERERRIRGVKKINERKTDGWTEKER